MKHSVTIDWDEDVSKFAIRCPMWANELVKNLPSARWSKPKRAWMVPLLRLTVEEVRRLSQMEGVLLNPPAKQQLDSYVAKKGREPKDGPGFPAWYRFKTKLKRADGSGVDEFPVYKHSLRVLNRKYGKKVFALHHDMGTAKTRTEIDYACALRMEGKIDAVLVLVKLSGRRNWLEQTNGPMSIARTTYSEGWAPIPCDVYLPNADKRQDYEKWLRRKHDFKWLVVGIESLSQGRMPEMVMQFLRSFNKVFAVIDEAHLISNHRAIRSEWCHKHFRPLCEYRDTATGTPVKGAPLDVFGLFEWLDPEIIGIGDYYAFRNRYAVVVEQKTKQGKKFPMVVGYQNIEELTRTLAPYVDEVRKSDVLDLPPKNYLPHVYVEPTAAQVALLKKIKQEGAYAVNAKSQEQVIKNVLELELRLHQVAQGFIPEYEEKAYIGRKGDDRIRRIAHWHPVVDPRRNPKINELVDICRADRQFIIWAVYRPVIAAIVERLADEFPKDSIVQIHGDTSEDDRALYRRQYQDGKHKFMVGNTATGGTADTWTACQTMVYYDNTNKMIDRAQSEDRAHRGGLDHPVDYIDLVMEGTPDVARIKSIEQKMDLSEYIRRNLKHWSDILEGKFDG